MSSASTLKRLGDICQVKYGKGLAQRERKAGNFPVMGSNGQVGTHVEAITSSPCILIGRKGSIGKLHLSESPCWPIDTAYFIDDSALVDPEYLFYFLHTTSLDKKNMAGAIPSLLRPDLEAVEVPMVPKDEQRRIVARIKGCLNRIEEIQSLRTEAAAEANAVLPSMLNNAFLQVGKEYGVAEIGDLSVETRYGTSSKCTTTPNGTAILRIPNVAGGFVNFNDLKYCHLAERDLDRLTLQQGDLLFVRTNGSRELVGRCAIFENKREATFAFASYLIRVRLAEDRMRPHFLSFFLNSTQGRTELDKRRRTSAGQFNINSENLRSIEVPVPPLDVQDVVIAKLRVQQDSVIALRNSLADVDAESLHLRDAILRRAFAGEL